MEWKIRGDKVNWDDWQKAKKKNRNENGCEWKRPDNNLVVVRANLDPKKHVI